MKIKSIKVWLEQLPLTKPYSIAYKTIVDTEIIFLEVTLENGITGIGAANPFAEVVGETPAVTLANLQQGFVQQFVGRDIRHFNKLIDESLIQFPHLPGTIAAIDIALHDAFCQYLGISIVKFYGHKTYPLPTSVTIGIKDIAAMMEEAKANYAAGFKVVKIKTGLSVEEDIERVVKLHEHFGNRLKVRVDANQGYDLLQLEHFIKKTSHLSLELIEQPMPVGKEKELAKLDESHRKLLAADESLIDAASALQLSFSPQPYGIFNIKLMKSGGIRGAREIALIAANASIDLFWGCNDESMVSIAAALQVAYSCSNTKYLDLDGSFDLSKDWVTGGFILKDGFLYCSNEPGLGLKKL
jgi:L-alanine-DL-glutamate epimerase-like enolase superfamily enzyme